MHKTRDFGLLLLRLGIGSMFVYHGWGKFFGGPPVWKSVGGAMGFVGISFVPTFWGFMAAFSEFIGGILMILGLGFQAALTLMCITMAVATTMHLSKGDGLSVASHAIENGIVFFSLIFIGPGRLSLDEKFKSGCCRQ